MNRHLRWAVSCYKEALVWLFGLAFGKEAVKLLVLSAGPVRACQRRHYSKETSPVLSNTAS